MLLKLATILADAPGPSIEEMQTGYQKSVWQIGITFFIILLAGVIIYWLYKRFAQSRTMAANSIKTIKILERRPLSPKSMLYLVEIGDKQVIIAESQHNITTVKHLDWGDNSEAKL
ncbi:MAG: flagellar biosynthetic protein FliO [Simkaniaceae bacterium]|nr:flagellar biosynthetic protein FliO [Simkaniaceae bacterium]